MFFLLFVYNETAIETTQIKFKKLFCKFVSDFYFQSISLLLWSQLKNKNLNLPSWRPRLLLARILLVLSHHRVTLLEGQITVVFIKIWTFCRLFLSLGIAPAHIKCSLRRRGGNIFVDLSLFVLLYDINFMNKLKFKN